MDKILGIPREWIRAGMTVEFLCWAAQGRDASVGGVCDPTQSDYVLHAAWEAWSEARTRGEGGERLKVAAWRLDGMFCEACAPIAKALEEGRD